MPTFRGRGRSGISADSSVRGESMLSFLVEPANLPFAVAVAVMIFFVLLEILSLSLGAGISELIDSLLPDLDMDLDLPDSSPSAFSQFLSWLRVGEVPLLMLILVALTAFGLSGFFLQALVQKITGNFLPPFLAIIPACFCAVPFIRIIGGLLHAYMPQDETTAVSEESLIGRTAIILAGTARQGKPVQAKVKDEHQYTHYIMVEPEQAEDRLSAGQSVILSGRKGAYFQAVPEETGEGPAT